jgi:hypothetical protein
VHGLSEFSAKRKKDMQGEVVVKPKQKTKPPIQCG